MPHALHLTALWIALSAASFAAAQTDVLRKNATGAPFTTLASIKPQSLRVTLRFEANGQLTSAAACSVPVSDTCTKPVLQAEQDAAYITYSTLAGFTAAPGDKVMLKACYAPNSQEMRPWRQSNPIIAKSKQCKFIIAKGLNPSQSPAGGVRWVPSEDVPSATYFVRALVMRNSTGPNGALSPVTYPAAYGDSGFFKAKKIDTRPTGMKVASALCTCVGPIMFGTYFALTYLRKPKG